MTVMSWPQTSPLQRKVKQLFGARSRYWQQKKKAPAAPRLTRPKTTNGATTAPMLDTEFATPTPDVRTAVGYTCAALFSALRSSRGRAGCISGGSAGKVLLYQNLTTGRVGQYCLKHRMQDKGCETASLGLLA